MSEQKESADATRRNELCVILAGPKGAGKSSVGALLAERLGLEPIETDTEVERLHASERGETLSCREIYNTHGADYFREIEARVVQGLAGAGDCVILTGGSTMMHPPSAETLARKGVVVLLTGDPDIIWQRIARRGLPAWLEGPDGPEKHRQIIAEREAVIRPLAQIVLNATDHTPETLAEMAADRVLGDYV